MKVTTDTWALLSGSCFDCNKKFLSRVNHLAKTSGNLDIYLALHRLPAIRPEPSLVGIDREHGSQLDDAVISLC